MTALQLAKKALRQELKQRLKGMTTENRSQQSQIIFKKLCDSDLYKKSQRISVYLSRDIEVDTKPVVLDILSSGKLCFIPKYDPNSTKMDMVLLKSFKEYEELPTTAWNIKQPNHDIEEDALSTGGLDLIIVPGIGFTRTGDRIGNGKGYYDIYLKRCQEKLGKEVPTIALCYKEQLVDSIPTSVTDVSIHQVISSDL